MKVKTTNVIGGFPLSARINIANAEQDKQAFSLLYNTLLKVGDIIERGIRDGEPGYKRALHDAREKLREIE